MLEGEDKAKIIGATIYIVEYEKTEMVRSLLKNGLDPRITHNLGYYGMTMYQIKMNSVKKLLKIRSPKEIRSESDCVALNFYLELVRKKADGAIIQFTKPNGKNKFN